MALKSMENVFTDPKIERWSKKLKKLLDYPGVPWNSLRRLEILEKEIKHGIKLCESSISSPVLKLLRDFLSAARDGSICEYYQQISEDKAGMIVEFSFKSETNKREGSP